jgi:hypothetical protein
VTEISAPARVDPAARTVSERAGNSASRTVLSSPFRGLLASAHRGAIPAEGPMRASGVTAEAQIAPSGTLKPLQRRVRRGPDEEDDRDTKSDGSARRPSHLDPMLCQMAMHPGVASLAVEPSTAAAASPPSSMREDLQSLISGLARRTAWGGDRRKGSARIELSEGVLAGATLTVHADDRSVSVELEMPSAMSSADDWERRIQERLEARGFAVNMRVG